MKTISNYDKKSHCTDSFVNHDQAKIWNKINETYFFVIELFTNQTKFMHLISR